jgi:hypothetical protein
MHDPHDNGGELDPRAAVALLEQTTSQAKREFDMRPPYMLLAGGVTIAIIYGTVWLSVRDQSPYYGPSYTALAVVYGTLALCIVLAATVARRALAGRSSERRKYEAITFGTIWICVYVFDGALHHEGVSRAIQYGIYPAAAPLVIVGSAAAAYELGREQWEWAFVPLAAAAIAACAGFAGPAGVWGVIALALPFLMAARAAQLWQRRA